MPHNNITRVETVLVECPTWSGNTREPEKSTRNLPDRGPPETVLKPTGQPDRARSNLKNTWCNSPDILLNSTFFAATLAQERVEACECVHFPNLVEHTSTHSFY